MDEVDEILKSGRVALVGLRVVKVAKKLVGGVEVRESAGRVVSE